MEVILLQKVENLGNLGDKVKVRAGYGRNFLIPQGKAKPATAKNIEEFEKRRAELEKHAAEAFEVHRLAQNVFHHLADQRMVRDGNRPGDILLAGLGFRENRCQQVI